MRRLSKQRVKYLQKLKHKDLSKSTVEELQRRVAEMKAELTRMKSDAARGILRKETGNIRALRRNIARVLTAISEKSSERVESGGR